MQGTGNVTYSAPFWLMLLQDTGLWWDYKKSDVSNWKLTFKPWLPTPDYSVVVW